MKTRFNSRMWRHPGSRTFVLLILALLLGLTLAQFARASSTPSPSASSSAAGGTSGKTVLHIGWVQEPDNLNPFIGIQGTDYMLWHMNYDFLVGFDAKTLQPRPELATSWQVSPDGKVWTFTIRSGDKWSDGQPVTANDVAFTFNYIVKNNLLNLSAYTDGITKAVALDPTHVKIYTKAPKANMLRMVVPILPEHIWSKISGKAAANTYQNAPPIVGDGPFRIVEWQKGKFIRLEANPDYWAGKPKVDEVVFELYTNPDTMAQDLKLGVIDGAINVPAAQFRQLGTQPGITANDAVSWQFTEIGMNCYDSPNSLGNPVLLDPKFRQAINWAVDRDKVVSVAMNGYASKGSSLIVPYSKYHWQPPADELFTYDPAKANQILDAAGYKDVNGDGYRETKAGKKLTLRFYATSDSPENQTAAKLIVGWLKDVGIRVELQVLDSGALIDAQYNYKGSTYAPDYDMFIWYWTQDVDPQFMLSIYTPQQIGGWNDCLWTDPTYTKLNTQQSTTIDEAKRKPIVDQMQQIFYQACPYAILAYPSQLEAYNTSKWQGWVHVPGDATGLQKGAVLYSYNNIDTYRLVEPKVAATAEQKKPLVNWKWLGVGMGGVIILVVIMLLLTRVFSKARREEE